MANPEHLQILQQGVAAWNQWQEQNKDIGPDLAGADLRGANLHGADFTGAILPEAILYEADLARATLRGATLIRANLRGADLTEADLTEANLIRANLTRATLSEADFTGAILHGATLRGADLTEADLTEAIFRGANLHGADISRVRLYETIFSDTILTAAQGLETCLHGGPSTLDHRTLAKSGPLPLVFLRGCGLPDALIEYLPSLLNQPFQFDSCFISYASTDQAFAERLYADLQNKGVRCWFAPEDMKIGDEFRSRIDASIHVHDRLLLILSEHSLTSRWVQKEVETAFEKEERDQRLVLFPIRLDEVVMQSTVGWAADIRRQRHIGDFTQWKDHDAYQRALTRLLRDLTAPVVPRLD